MRVPLSWLREFTPLELAANDERGVNELGDELSMLGLHVEGTERIDPSLDGVVVARVTEIRPIKGADRIRLVLVDSGAGSPLEVVCGAWNFSEGDLVPFATVGAKLPGGVEITRRQMRGVVSNGMICSSRELGLGADAAGIFVLASPAPGSPLPPGAELGAPLADYLGLEEDVVFDLEIEPNRPDALSILGVARDIAAHRRLPLFVPEPEVSEGGPPVGRLASAAIDAPDACRRLVVRVITGVSDVPGTRLIRRRLILSGMRPIHAVVDASNYVMLELGQPTHPYDLALLDGRGIRVRFAVRGERLTTLDGVERTVGERRRLDGSTEPADDLLICDAKDAPVGLAGIMGGAASEIAGATEQVLLECAEFDSAVIGRTAQRQGLRSEAATRFWRGVDPEGVRRAADRVAQLIVECSEAAGVPAPVVASGAIDLNPRPFVRPRIHLRTPRVNATLGTSLETAAIADLISPIGFSSVASGDGLDVEVPSFRPDVTREVDVIEEVARHFGYEKIAPTSPRSPQVGLLRPHQAERRAVARLLAGFGAHEAWTAAIVNREREDPLGELPGAVQLANPVIREESSLRRHLLPGLLAALGHNAAVRNPSVRLFEIGKVFHGSQDDLPSEREHLGVLLGRDGDSAATAVSCLRFIAEGLRIDPHGFELVPYGEADDPVTLYGCHPTRSAVLRGSPEESGSPSVGAVGEVDPAALERFDLGGRRVGWLALDLERFFSLRRLPEKARPVSRFPSSDIDLSFALDEAIPAARLQSVLEQAAGDWLERIELVDVYRGPGIREGRRSLAFRLRFAALDRTLTDADVAAVRARCIASAEAELAAELRG